MKHRREELISRSFTENDSKHYQRLCKSAILGAGHVKHVLHNCPLTDELKDAQLVTKQTSKKDQYVARYGSREELFIVNEQIRIGSVSTPHCQKND